MLNYSERVSEASMLFVDLMGMECFCKGEWLFAPVM
jgi:hypothetical protein